jgi:hypothetical protein
VWNHRGHNGKLFTLRKAAKMLVFLNVENRPLVIYGMRAMVSTVWQMLSTQLVNVTNSLSTVEFAPHSGRPEICHLRSDEFQVEYISSGLLGPPCP